MNTDTGQIYVGEKNIMAALARRETLIGLAREEAEEIEAMRGAGQVPAGEKPLRTLKRAARRLAERKAVKAARARCR